MNSEIIKVSNLVTQFGPNKIHDGVSITIGSGEIYGILGGSGSGKSTLLKEMILLLRPESGEISFFGQNILTMNSASLTKLRQQWGVLFQGGALYTSLTVTENIAVQLKEYSDLPAALIYDIVQMKINMVGLPQHAGSLYPSELSGGMVKRVALARALAMDPVLLFLDEPTSGLDPVSANMFDQLILDLRDMLGLTIVMVTHDLESIKTTVDRFCVLGEKKVIAEGSLEDVLINPHPWVKQFFTGKRGQTRN